MVQVLIDNVTYYLLQYITCYCQSDRSWWNQDTVKMSSVKKCFAYVQAILWSVSAQISITHLCQPILASANYTVSWDDTGRPWAACSMTLYWWRKASLLLCTFILSSNTVRMLIFVRRIFRECPVSEDFRDYIFMRRTLSKALWPVRVTTAAITQQQEKYYKHLPSNLFCSRSQTSLVGFSRRHSVLAIGSHSKLHGGVHL